MSGRATESIRRATDLTFSLRGVLSSSEELTPEEFGQWQEVFDRNDVWWAPVQATHEAVEDVQVRANRGVVDVPLGDGSVAEMVATPVDFEGTPWEVRALPPELGQHTELILAEDLGLGWDEIEALREAGVIP